MELSEVTEESFVLLPAHWAVAQALAFIEGLTFTHIIVHRKEPENDYYYLYPRVRALDMLGRSDPGQTIHVAFDLHEYKSVETREANESADDAPDQVVVLKGGEVAGFFDVTEGGGFFGKGGKGGSRGPMAPGMPPRFEAYPSLEAPDRVTPDEQFDIFVGFRSDMDPVLLQSGQMIFNLIEQGDECSILVIPDGVDIDRNFDSLPFRQNAQVRFICRPKPGVTDATIKAQYYYKHQLIGTAQRSLVITAAKLVAPAPAQPASNHCPMAIPSPEMNVDLTVTITYSADGKLQWTFTSPNPPIETTTPIITELQGAQQFAAGLIKDLKTEEHTGILASNILENKGQEIFTLMPPEFIDSLRRVHAAIGRTPTLLLLTNETYVPWELAYLAEPLDPAAPNYLAAQTYLGRWLDDQNVMLPPAVELEVERITAVASRYGLGSSQRELPEAIAEQDLLTNRWKAIALEAKKPDVTPVLSGSRVPGHLIHFAVHGISDPGANHQAILLADNTQIVAGALTGSYKCGEVPRFAFVFLNACQVGTAGESLGQAAGFPGTLVRRGALGFIAPLWEVDDRLALEFATVFYQETLGEHKPIGVVLHDRRSTYDPAKSTTPIAYIYYGHPGLRLTRM